MYSDVSLFIDGAWGPAAGGRTIDVVNPATGDKIGTVPHAAITDIARALAAADKGFKIWRKVSAFDRSKVMRKAADILRERADKIALLLTMEQGKPLAEAKGEVLAGADVKCSAWSHATDLVDECAVGVAAPDLLAPVAMVPVGLVG